MRPSSAERFSVESSEASYVRQRTEPLSWEGVASLQTSSLVAAGAAQDVSDLQTSVGGKLSVLQAWVVMFCTAFGAGIALVGWYPKLAGYIGYLIVLTIVAGSASLAEEALFSTARTTNATSFGDLTRTLPKWMGTLTSCSSIAWGFTLVGFYTQFCYTFVNQQILGNLFPEAGFESLPLYLPLGCLIFCATLPSNFSGPLSKFFNNVNLVTTWVVIVMAIIKGMHTILTVEPGVRAHMEFTSLRSEGLMKITVLLSGSMFQCTCVPQLNHEIRPDKRQTAAFVVPVGVAVVQACVFAIVGLLGYFALGNSIQDDGDVFSTYFDLHPDWMVTVLQGGIANLMFLSTPLLGLPPKAELWGMVAKTNEHGQKVSFENAPVVARLCLNCLLTIFAVSMPVLLGKEGYMSLVTICAGTASNWVNLFLPSFVILWNQVLPARSSGQPWVGSAMKTGWILLLASASAVSSILTISQLMTKEGNTTTTATTTTTSYA